MDIKEDDESRVITPTELQLHDSVTARTGKSVSNHIIHNH